jgi:putative ABC transport system substrate-binding protein
LAFQSRLQELGWTDGRNLVILNRFAEGDSSRLKALAADLAAAKVDVIHTFFTYGVRAAREGAPDTPIVFSIIGDPVEDGLVASLARPGGNLTGASTRDTELYPKRVQLAKELLPRAKRVAVLLDAPGARGVPPPRVELAVRDLVRTGERLGLAVTRYYVGSFDELGAAFDRMASEKADVVLMLAIWLTGAKGRPLIIEQATRTRLPTVYPSSAFVEEGGLMAYSQSIPELGRRAASYVDKILRGARPAELPIVFELAINLKTARALGLSIPRPILLRADRVIE